VSVLHRAVARASSPLLLGAEFDIYSGELSSYVEANGYFGAIVPISRLMGLT